jgi:hypothetical protein
MALGDASGGIGSSTTTNAGAPVLLTTLTVADMPMSSKSKGAPRKFTGKYNKILPFLRDYELLLTKCGVVSDEAKCSLLERYVSEHVWEVVEGLSEYNLDDWDGLKDRLKTLYDADWVAH